MIAISRQGDISLLRWKPPNMPPLKNLIIELKELENKIQGGLDSLLAMVEGKDE